MSAQHTPGPWKWHTPATTSARHPAYVTSGNSYIAALYHTDNQGETHPNARLIAAAPDLLAALELCEGNISSLAAAHPNIYSEWLAVVSAAIAKATELQGSAK